jgi:hypothetical protein
MTDAIVKAQATVQQMKRMLDGLEGIVEVLPKNPQLYAMTAEAPLELLSRLRDELEQHLAEIKFDSKSQSQLAPVQQDSENP